MWLAKNSNLELLIPVIVDFIIFNRYLSIILILKKLKKTNLLHKIFDEKFRSKNWNANVLKSFVVLLIPFVKIFLLQIKIKNNKNKNEIITNEEEPKI